MDFGLRALYLTKRPSKGGFITNPLSVTEWNLTMFSIIFYKVSSLDNVKQRQKRPKKRLSLSTVEDF